MKTLLISFTFLIINSSLLSQETEEVKALISEGIALHDKGDYDGAIKKYNAALDIDKNSFHALYEKSYTLFAISDFKECAKISKDLLKKYGDHPEAVLVYIQYGSALDELGKVKDAIEAYDEGIGKFPNEYLLYFNRGLTEMKANKNEDAIKSYQSAMQLKPLHSSSNYYTGMLLQKVNKVPAVMAYMTFLAIEPQTKRSKDAYDRVVSILEANVKREGNNVTLFLDPSMFDKSKKKDGENDFSSIEMLFSLLSATDNAKGVDSIAKTPADKLSFKLQMLINSLTEQKKDGKGFYWEHYVPFLGEMKEKNHIGTLAYLMLKHTNDDSITEWLEKNEKNVTAFYDWIKEYKWQK
jgi:tetratricopeptide (TPR) repeat protein